MIEDAHIFALSVLFADGGERIGAAWSASSGLHFCGQTKKSHLFFATTRLLAPFAVGPNSRRQV